MKQTKAAGAARERQVRELFRSRGYVVFKSSDSAVADVIAFRRLANTALWFPPSVNPPPIPPIADVLLIEVKANVGGPYMNFRAPERAALRAVAEKAGAQALLVHWAPGKPCREIPADEWPDERKEAA